MYEPKGAGQEEIDCGGGAGASEIHGMVAQTPRGAGANDAYARLVDATILDWHGAVRWITA